MSLAFLITTFLVVASPGTGVLLTLSAGLSHGVRGAAVASLGCTLGILPHMAVAISGLAAVLHASDLAFQLLKAAGVGYLLYLAWATVREKAGMRLDASASALTDTQGIWRAMLVNMLNPKLSMFFVAFLPQFVRVGDASATQTMLQLSAIFMAMTFCVFLLYGVFAAGAREHILSRPAVLAWLRRGFAAAFLGLAFKLALAQR